MITLTKPQVSGSNIDTIFNNWRQLNKIITIYYLKYNEDQKIPTLSHVGGHQSQVKKTVRELMQENFQ